MVILEFLKRGRKEFPPLLRSRDRIEKMLDQANLEEIIDEVRYVELRLDSADYKLAGPDYAYSSSEE